MSGVIPSSSFLLSVAGSHCGARLRRVAARQKVLFELYVFRSCSIGLGAGNPGPTQRQRILGAALAARKHMVVALEVDTSRPAAAEKRSSPSIHRGNPKQPEATTDDPERLSNFSQQVCEMPSATIPSADSD